MPWLWFHSVSHLQIVTEEPFGVIHANSAGDGLPIGDVIRCLVASVKWCRRFGAVTI